MFRLFSIFIISIIFSHFSMAFSPDSIVSFPILDYQRLLLTQQYAKRHYGLNTYLLVQPQLIVIHFSLLPTLKPSLGQYLGAYLPDHRIKLLPDGPLNVGVHYVVDVDGTIYSLLPTTVMGRHTIGFDYTAIGIVNVGSTVQDLTDAQVRANADLVYYLTQKHPSITYLIGRHEYLNQRLPHYVLRITKDPSADTPIKIDPGFDFMRKVRAVLLKEYSLQLQS